MIRRREFITLLGSTAAAWPLAARAQQVGMPVIGLLSASAYHNARMSAFREGLMEIGCIEGQNTIMEFRGAEGRYELLRALAVDLVGRRVRVIAVNSTEGALAAKIATDTIPIVFVIGSDPVRAGLVASLNRPGGNVTGVSLLTHALDAKRLEMIREIIPAAKIIGVLFNPKNADAEPQLQDLQTAAQAVGQKVYVLNASTKREINEAFKAFAQLRGDALMVSSDNFLNDQSDQIAALSYSFSIPTIAARREFTTSGILLSYGPSITEAFHQQGNYVGRISRARSPAICPRYSQQNLNWSLINRPPRRSVSMCRRRCSRALTR